MPASRPVLRKLAKVLGVRTSALIGEAPSEDHEGPVNPRLAEVEQALVTYRSIMLSDETEVPELSELAQQIEAGWQALVYLAAQVQRHLPDAAAADRQFRAGGVCIRSFTRSLPPGVRGLSHPWSARPLISTRSHAATTAATTTRRCSSTSRWPRRSALRASAIIRIARDMVATLVKRAKPSYASEVRAFASHIALLD